VVTRRFLEKGSEMTYFRRSPQNPARKSQGSKVIASILGTHAQAQGPSVFNRKE